MPASTTSEDQASTKASLRAWWSTFTKTRLPGGKDKKQNDQKVFGVPLRQSLKYASVAISMAGEDGRQYVWGYVPVIVAKIGLYLKENATEVEGVFRKAGSQKRMSMLQETFDTPPRYGKSVDWSKYSVHDAASVLRRYLNHMPEPIVPLDLYTEFRNVMAKELFESESALKTYRLLISSMPPANQYLLLYVLDLLAVFAKKADKNLMPSSNLAVIFQPGMFSHPSHVQSPSEHKLAVQVLEFLIDHQDHFVLDLSPTPPTNFANDDLTAVSKPLEDEDIIQPSDSDEDQGELQVHEGGGARLMRSLTSRPKKSASKKRGVSRNRKTENEEEAAGEEEHGAGPFEVGQESGETLGAIVPLNGATGIRRSRTAPSRKVSEGSSPMRKARRPRASAGNPIAEPVPEAKKVPEASSSLKPGMAMQKTASSTGAEERALNSESGSGPNSVPMSKSNTINTLGLLTPPSSKILSENASSSAS